MFSSLTEWKWPEVKCIGAGVLLFTGCGTSVEAFYPFGIQRIPLVKWGQVPSYLVGEKLL